MTGIERYDCIRGVHLWAAAAAGGQGPGTTADDNHGPVPKTTTLNENVFASREADIEDRFALPRVTCPWQCLHQD